MKRPGLLLFFWLTYLDLSAQSLHLKDLMGLLDLNLSKLEAHIQKKGFKRSSLFTDNDFSYSLVRYDKKPVANTIRCFQIRQGENGSSLLYHTNCAEEYNNLESELKSSGFTASTPVDGTVYFQKQNMELACRTQQVDTCLFYSLTAVRKKLPRPRDLQFAEDLLQFEGHAYLTETFGKEHVVTDRFYFSDSAKTTCSVLFPNSNKQAVFVWKDEANLRQLSFVVIGEQPGQEPEGNLNTVMLSSWRSRQGIYCGMSLKELEWLNRGSIHFYNWRTALAGTIAPGNRGQIDFNRISVLFSCLNCSYQIISGYSEIIDSGSALAADQKIYVTAYIVRPSKQDVPNGQ